MSKKILLIILIFLGLGIFGNEAWAQKLPEPSGLEANKIGEGMATFHWSWSGKDDQITHFELYYPSCVELKGPVWQLCEGDSIDVETCKAVKDWGEAATPGKGTRDKQITGLYGDTWYCWKLRAVAVGGGKSSDFVYGLPFKTLGEEVDEEPKPGGPVGLTNPMEAETLWEAIEALINFLLLFAFAIAPILIIYAAFLMLFHPDDPKAINKAKAIIFWTLVALGAILLAKILPGAVKDALGG